ncbi:MAG: PEP-CTERM sorting domain-containing protein [Phycisphaerae bacterium]
MRMLLGSIAVMLCIPALAWADARYTVIDLGGFDPMQKSAAWGINNAGQVVGWAFLETAPNVYYMRAFMWEDGSIHDLGALPGEERSAALQINAHGQIAGDAGYTSIHAVVWNVGNQIIRDLGTLGGLHSGARAINDAGQVVGFSHMPGQCCSHAFLWTLEDGMVDLGTLPIGHSTEARGINNLGQVVGFTGPHFRAFVWEDGHLRYIDPDAETSLETTFANGVNDSGIVVGLISGGSGESYYQHGCVWNLRTGERIDVGALPGYENGVLYRVNAAGHAVGMVMDPYHGDVHRAVLYDGEGLVDLNALIPLDSGWTLWEAWDINDDGWIVGCGVSPNGVTHGFLLVPEPGTLALLALAGLALLGRRSMASAKDARADSRPSGAAQFGFRTYAAREQRSSRG